MSDQRMKGRREGEKRENGMCLLELSWEWGVERRHVGKKHRKEREKVKTMHQCKGGYLEYKPICSLTFGIIRER